MKEEQTISKEIAVKCNNTVPLTIIDMNKKAPSNKIQAKRTKPSKLLNTIRPMEDNEIQRMSINAFHRILDAEGLLISKIY